MKKVCHMTSAHNSQDVRILKKQCVSLASAGYETYLVAKGESYIESGVQVVGIGNIQGGRIRRMTMATKKVYEESLRLDCDIYQIHDPELLPYALKLKKKGKKVIFDSHENYVMQIKEKYYLPKLLRKSISKLYEIYQNHILKRIDAVIFPCLKDGKHIFEEKCKYVEIIGNEPLLNELYEQFDASKEKREKVCQVGGLTYARGIYHLIEAAFKVNVPVVLGGNITPSGFKLELENRESFSGVEYRGFCNRSAVVEIYKECSIGVCTILNIGQYNKLDNFATKVYEYMSMGLPVILSDYPYARKINEEYNFAILVEPDNVEQISEAILYLIKNKDIASEMGENGRRAIKERFNWNIEEVKLLKLYEELSR